METRMKMKTVEPEGYKAMMLFDKYLSTTQLSVRHKDLIKIRASQINGCSYCMDKHIREARETGETERRIYGLTAWRETPFYTEDEQAVLALTDEVTLITQRVSDETYRRAVETLGEKYVAQVIFAIIGANAWSRIGVATNMMPS